MVQEDRDLRLAKFGRAAFAADENEALCLGTYVASVRKLMCFRRTVLQT